MLDAAREEFFERGLGKATIERIARRANVTKVTVYRRYVDKYALFEAVIADAAEKLFADLSGLQLNPDTPGESLRKAAEAVSRTYQSRVHIEVTRLMIAETPRHPEVCQQARAKMIAVIGGDLRPFFQGLSARGWMEESVVQHAVLTFILVFSKGFRPLFGVSLGEGGEARQFEADLAMFARGYGIPYRSFPENPGFSASVG
ncbi:TetR/AcrR family transcriptional regulator [Parahaliea aestuarii]|uniref:TetR/AcrR family transcriptional regulator n=1 Tax=Parahaliea aestuarii TaxID=1852021 RepID=UPI00164F203A|nr:TetR/AcrR family transcriptional regulator [Parahaliea aestuarii]